MDRHDHETRGHEQQQHHRQDVLDAHGFGLLRYEMPAVT